MDILRDGFLVVLRFSIWTLFKSKVVAIEGEYVVEFGGRIGMVAK